MATRSRSRGRKRDDFSAKVKRHVADEVGHTCSNPNCRAPTIGPGDQGRISNVGVAAHVTAASQGGPRYDRALTAEQRKAAENAIHVCQTCGKLVDDALSTYDEPLLRKWKADAIELRRRALACRDVDPDGTIQLDRQARHEAASSAYQLALELQHILVVGHATWRISGREFATRPYVVKENVDAWLLEHQARHSEGGSALQRIRAQWGHTTPCEGAAAMATILNESGYWRERFEMFLARLISEDYFPFGGTVYHGFDEDKIVDEPFVETNRRAVGDALARLDAWAREHIATRRTAHLRKQ